MLDYKLNLDETLQAKVPDIAQALLFQAATNGNLNQLNLALKTGFIDVNRINESGQTAWALAAANNHPAFIYYLNQLGATVPEDYFRLQTLRSKLASVKDANAAEKLPDNVLSSDQKAIKKQITELVLAPTQNLNLIHSSIMISQLLDDYKKPKLSLNNELVTIARDFMHNQLGHCHEKQQTKIIVTWFKIRILSVLCDTPSFQMHMLKFMSALSHQDKLNVINFKDGKGLTLLCYAKKELNFFNIDLFLQYGANIDPVLDEFKTWRQIAPDYFELLLLTIVYTNLTKNYNSLNSLVHLAVIHDISELILLRKMAGLPLNNGNQDKQTPLNLAISKGENGAKIAAQLLISGINPDVSQQVQLLEIGVNLYSCSNERTALNEKSSQEMKFNQASLRANTVTLIKAIIDTRKDNQALAVKVVTLETKMNMQTMEIEALKQSFAQLLQKVNNTANASNASSSAGFFK